MSLQQEEEDLVPANPQVLSVSLFPSDLFFSLLPFPPFPSMLHLFSHLFFPSPSPHPQEMAWCSGKTMGFGVKQTWD